MCALTKFKFIFGIACDNKYLFDKVVIVILVIQYLWFSLLLHH